MKTDPRIEAAALAIMDAAFGQELPEAPEDLARAALAAADRAAADRVAVITTAEELLSLPPGSVILNSLGEAVSKRGSYWYLPGIRHRFCRVESLPARVIHWGNDE